MVHIILNIFYESLLFVIFLYPCKHGPPLHIEFELLVCLLLFSKQKVGDY